MLSHTTTLYTFLLMLASMVAAAPVEAQGHGNTWGYASGGGVVGFIVLVLDIIVFIEVLKSSRPPINKLLWCLLVFLFPIGGVIIYYLFAQRSASGYEPIA